MSNSDSDSDGPSAHIPDDIETIQPREAVEDLAEEEDSFSDSQASLPALTLSDGAPSIKPRSYQIEMLEESLKHNTIVAADTGSGKTHIAVLRILYELERTPQHQLIWFLAPTIALCTQQFEYLQSQISSVQIKCLKGEDGVDRWTSQNDWDTVLNNVRIVVSTYQVLLDAVTHGFVKMGSLSLIVFDEAHNCVGNNPGAKIMRSFYHSKKSQGLPVPHILGLTASPVMRSDPKSLEKIEQTLDAVARTPTKSRAELRLQVNLPVLAQVFYQSLPDPEQLTGYTETIQSLSLIFVSLNIAEDPFVLSLISEDSEKSRQKLQKVMKNHRTWCQNQMKTFHATSLKICQEMGAYGADWYISQVVANSAKLTDDRDDFPEIWDVSNAEKLFLAKALGQVKQKRFANHVPAAVIVSDKIEKLIDTLLQGPSAIQGIIFVQTRAEVGVLFHILSIHPRTRGRFILGTMIGTSTHSYRAKNIGELVDVGSQKQTLSRFKTGAINLVIATSVLEEGIDVPACNLVVCFQKPANLKSFVQRRGRARHRESRLILLLDPRKDKLNDWQKLEADMKKFYEDEMRALNEALVLEDTEQHDDRKIQINSTGALLDLDNALAHLYHFCAVLPRTEYVNSRPEFICSVEGPSIRCKVILPLSVIDSVRKHESRNSWKSEKNAMKDAAFEAYVALYRAGLVNDNLLPLLRHDAVVDGLFRFEVEKRAAIMEIEDQLNPWVQLAKLCKVTGKIRKCVLSFMESTTDNCGLCYESFRSDDRLRVEDVKVGIYTPVELPLIKPFRVYWDANSEFSVLISPTNFQPSLDELLRINEDNLAILEASFGTRFQTERRQFPILFSPEGGAPVREQMGFQPVRDAEQAARSSGLIRDKADTNISYRYIEWLPEKPSIEAVQNPYKNYGELSKETPHLSLVRIPRRFDFLHKPVDKRLISAKRYSTVLPISRCTVDTLPFRIVQFGRLIPSVLRRLEITLIADEVSKKMLKEVQISDLDLIITAITASSACEDSNYQRLEFLGDSILKTCTSIQLVAEFPLWHEGYLSAKKDRLVSNSRLSRAAVESGLDKYIVTKAFNGKKWRPSCVDELLDAKTSKRKTSSKVLADVVEALIGASMVDGGIEKALKCLSVFLPELDWQPLNVRREALLQRVPDVDLPPTLQLLEGLIGYTFKNKALLIESMTHASNNMGTQSLERLEFLGDSILDNIVVTEMWKQQPELSHFQMHLLRTALVNADFLAFVCMEWATQQEKTDLVEVKTTDENGEIVCGFKAVSTKVSLPLWRFMRHMSPKLGAVQVATAKRHAELRGEINEAIQRGMYYPWALLAKMQAQKFYSDLIESLLGAVWIDCGSLDVCQGIVESMGILPYMKRILREKVQIWHPKEEIGVLADTEMVKYVIERRKVEGSEEGERKEYWCKVSVGEEEVVEIGGGVSKEEVKTKAAELAIRILKSRKTEGTGGVESTAVDIVNGQGIRVEGVDLDTVMEI